MGNVKEVEYEYNPIKEIKNGDAAVIWTTKALEAAVDGINKGLPLKTNPFCGKNTKLLRPDLVYKRTPEEVEDYIKCMNDPIYFAEKCYLMTPEGLQRVKLRDYQVEYIKSLQANRFSILLACRQAGKSTTTALYCLWKILFNTDKTGLILSKSGPAGVDLISKIKDMYLFLPYHLKCGTMKWNQHEISFDNNSSISTEAFSSTAGLGKTINFLILDEFAWCPPGEVELFYNNIIPTITTITDSNVCIMSTQNSFNLFYKLWDGAIKKKNIYAPFKIDWYQVPQWNPKTKRWEKRDEKWKEEMIGVLGSEEAFYYQYGTQFSASDYCLVSRAKLSELRDNAVLFINRNELVYESEHKDCLFFHPEFDVNRLKTGRFVILVDLAEGGGGDYTVFNILEISEKDKFEQIGFWRSNKLNIETAALEFWLMVNQLFNQENLLISIEWNTYGALFYNYLFNLNDSDYYDEYAWRFYYGEELDLGATVVRYKKGDNTDELAGLSMKLKFTNMIPGIRFNGSNKITACSLLKMALERGDIILYDLIQIGELENFEDKHGSGTYKASYGHDDMMMTLCQIPMLMQTLRYKNFIEEMNLDVQIQVSKSKEWEGEDAISDIYSAIPQRR